MNGLVTLVLRIQAKKIPFIVFVFALVVVCAVDARILGKDSFELIVNVVLAVFEARVQSVLPTRAVDRHLVVQDLLRETGAVIVLLLVFCERLLCNLTHVDSILGLPSYFIELTLSVFEMPSLVVSWACSLWMLEILLDVVGLRIPEEPIETIAVQFDDLVVHAFARQARKEGSVATAVAMQASIAYVLVLSVLRADNENHDDKEDEEVAAVSQAPHCKIDSLLQLNRFVLVPELEPLLVLKEERFKSWNVQSGLRI